MSETGFFWQGGRKIDIQKDDSAITIHAPSEADAHRAAEQAGVAVGDAVLAIGGRETDDLAEVRALVARLPTDRCTRVLWQWGQQRLELELLAQPLPLEPLGAGEVVLDEVPWRAYRLRTVWSFPEGAGPVPARARRAARRRGGRAGARAFRGTRRGGTWVRRRARSGTRRRSGAGWGSPSCGRWCGPQLGAWPTIPRATPCTPGRRTPRSTRGTGTTRTRGSR